METRVKDGLSDLKIMKSHRGYYLGKEYTHPEGWTEPYVRESSYYVTKEEAEGELAKYEEA
jgi:hypothetical protein